MKLILNLILTVTKAIGFVWLGRAVLTVIGIDSKKWKYGDWQFRLYVFIILVCIATLPLEFA